MRKAPQPPLFKTGEINFEAWKNRLLTKYIKGDIDSIINRAKGTNADALAAQGELRNLERYADDSYDIFILTPPSGIDAVKEVRTAEAIITKGGVVKKLEIKTATKPPVKQTWNKHIDKANTQIKTEGACGIIVLDFSQISLRRGDKYFSNQADVEAFLKGKVTGDAKTGRLRNVDELEIIYRDSMDGKLKRSIIRRDLSGGVLPPETEEVE